MSWFFCRIEFHKKAGQKVSAEDYNVLHEEMRKRGFIPFIEGDNGLTYHLLTGEYRKESDQTIQGAYEDALSAANAAKKKSPEVLSFSAFVCLFSSARWEGLPQVQK